MAINYNNFVSSKTTNTPTVKGIDYNKFVASKSPTVSNVATSPTISPKQAAVNKYMEEVRVKTEKELADSGVSMTVGGNLKNTLKKAALGATTLAFKGVRKLADLEKTIVGDKITDIKEGAVKLGLAGSKAKQEQISKEKTPEYQLEKALRKEKKAETVAKITTAPVRILGSYSGAPLASYALEKTDSNYKYTPKTDAEKLIFGEDSIQRLMKQDDMYGMIARGAGAQTALAAMVLIENPFVGGLGIKKSIKEIIENGVKKQGAEYLSRLSSKELIDHIDNLVKIEVQHGLDKKTADEFINGLKGVRIREIQAPAKQLALPAGKETGIKTGDGFIMKAGSTADELKLSKLQSDYSKSLQRYNKFPTEANLIATKNKKELLNTFSKEIKEAKPQEIITNIQDIKPIKPLASEYTEQITKEAPTEITDTIVKGAPNVKEVKSVEAPKLMENGLKESGVAKTFKAEAIEKDLKEATGEIAGYVPRGVKEQSEKISDLVNNNLDLAKKIVKGEVETPTDISGAFLLRTMQNYAKKSGDAQLVEDLIKSPLNSKISQAGSEMRMFRRSDDDPFKIIDDISEYKERSRSGVIFGDNDKVAKKLKETKTKELKKIEKSIVSKPVKKKEWLSFIESIKC